jgi:hypothetical protein
MDVRLPDGTVIKNVPEGTTKAQLLEKLKANGTAVPSEWMPESAPAAVEAGTQIRGIPRQVGLTARYGIEGLGRLADIGTEPIRQLAVNPLLRQLGMNEASSVSGAAVDLANRVGLPSPEGANERVIGEAARTMVGAGGLAGVAGKTAQALAPGVARETASVLAAKPAMQIAGGAGAGAAGSAVKEAGGGPLEQFGAALGGGVLGGMTADKTTNLTQVAARKWLTPQATQLQAADQQIALVLERSGIDWNQVPERVKQGMRAEVASALTSGQPLSADALRRLLVFRSTGTTPTVGMLTQNPGQITREMNLAKTAANMTDESMQRLPAIQNENVTRLLAQLDEAGAARAPTARGVAEIAIQDLTARQRSAEASIDALYARARDTQGRSLPLQGGAFSQRANQLLDEAMAGGALPSDVANTMNRIARGEMPFTVEIAEQMKTRIGQLQRSSGDGTTRYALGLVRQALDETPLQPINTRNLPAIPDAPTAQGAGEQSIEAFKQARSANRQWMQRVEGNPALRAVVDGVEPDQFVRRFITGQGASVADVRALRSELGAEGIAAVRNYLVRYLRDAATNNTDDIAKFSNDAYRRALRDIGDEKLALFFNREELQRLRNIGEAAKYMQAQPAGTAVNNSNSGALALGRGIELLDRAASWLPMGRDVVRGKITGPRLQSQVLKPRYGLLEQQLPQMQPLPVNPLLAGILAPAEERKNDRRH